MLFLAVPQTFKYNYVIHCSALKFSRNKNIENKI